MHTLNYDFLIVGAGIIGLTVANEVSLRHPQARIAVMDKEEAIGLHASGRNSGVLHCGIYYSSDTLKASLCAKGAKQMVEFAKEYDIACYKTGKVIVATNEAETIALDRLLKNATENDIKAHRINEEELHEIEPHAASAPAALYCPDTAVIDSPAVLNRLKQLLMDRGVHILLGYEFKDLSSHQSITTSKGILNFGYLFNCAGSYADKVARKFGLSQHYVLIPFKGIYWKLAENAKWLVNANIYPVPDVSLPFLGIHLTRVISGDVYIGPTAIPALGRENYGLFENIELGESLQIGMHLGKMFLTNNNNFRKLAYVEIAKYHKASFLKAAQKLVPKLTLDAMNSSPKVGIRPQLINSQNNQLEMDYIIEQTENSMHVLNAISPAFTSAFAFSKMIVDRSELRS